MPPLLDAHPAITAEVIAVAPVAAPAIERFPPAFYDLSRPIGNVPSPAMTGTRGASVRMLVRLGNAVARPRSRG